MEQHRQGADHSRWLPDGDMAQAAQDQPWPAAYALGSRMRDAAASMTVGIEASDLVLHLHMTAFLELLGADSDRCDDPFQCSLYLTTVRRDFDNAAKNYVREHGGKKAVTRMMKARLGELPAQLKAKPPRPSVRLATDDDGPRIGELARASPLGLAEAA